MDIEYCFSCCDVSSSENDVYLIVIPYGIGMTNYAFFVLYNFFCLYCVIV